MLTHCAHIFQSVLLSIGDLEAARVMRRNESVDVFFPAMPVKLNLSFPLQTYKSIVSFKMNPESGVCILSFVVKR